jgi:hypothetical protein
MSFGNLLLTDRPVQKEGCVKTDKYKGLFFLRCPHSVGKNGRALSQFSTAIYLSFSGHRGAFAFIYLYGLTFAQI